MKQTSAHAVAPTFSHESGNRNLEALLNSAGTEPRTPYTYRCYYYDGFEIVQYDCRQANGEVYYSCNDAHQKVLQKIVYRNTAGKATKFLEV